MPLSEDEQRVLRDIERNFYENDPKFAKVVESSDPFPNARRNAKLAIAGFFVCLVALLATFTENLIVGFIAFLGMVACAFLAYQSIRRTAGVDGSDDGIAAMRYRLRKRFSQE